MCTCLFVVLTITVTWLLGDTTFSQPKDLQVGINSGPGTQDKGSRGTHEDPVSFWNLYSSQYSILVLGTSASSLA